VYDIGDNNSGEGIRLYATAITHSVDVKGQQSRTTIQGRYVRRRDATCKGLNVYTSTLYGTTAASSSTSTSTPGLLKGGFTNSKGEPAGPQGGFNGFTNAGRLTSQIILPDVIGDYKSNMPTSSLLGPAK